MKNKNVNFFIAVALIIGTVIGAGVLGIPYVIAQTGWAPGLSLIHISEPTRPY